jgi:hypothetical protein
LNHPFSSVSLGGSDLYAQMGDSDAMPIVGNFDPPMGGAATSAPTPTPSSLTVTLVGTAGNDTFSFAPGSAANTWSITLNGVAKIYTAASINVSFNGQGGIDTAIIHGAGANQTAVLRPGSGTFSGRGYQVYVVAEAITADVDGGRGQATFYGQALSTNYFSGSPTMAQMSDSASAAWKDYFNSETGFQSVAAYGTPGGRDLALANDGGVKSVFSAAGHAATLTTLDPKTADYALALYDFGTVTATLKNKATVRNRAAIDYLLMFSNP